MMNCYVYRHIRLDNNEVFYIGIGKTKRFKRAYEKTRRSEFWHNIVNKAGYRVEIMFHSISWEEACKIERILISHYGRRDLMNGTLVNLTDGGDGSTNTSEIVKSKISNSLRGKTQSEETRAKRSESLKITWSSPELRAIKREQTTRLIKDGVIKCNRGKVGPNKGKVFCSDVRAKISAASKRFFSDPELRNKMAIERGAKWFNVYEAAEVTKGNRWGKGFAKKGSLVLSHFNKSEVSRMLNISVGNIGKCLRGQTLTANNLIFEYASV